MATNRLGDCLHSTRHGPEPTSQASRTGAVSPPAGNGCVFADVRDPEDACSPLASAPRGNARGRAVLGACSARRVRVQYAYGRSSFHQPATLSLRPNAGGHHPSPDKTIGNIDDDDGQCCVKYSLLTQTESDIRSICDRTDASEIVEGPSPVS